jgi:hypothetical protein
MKHKTQRFSTQGCEKGKGKQRKCEGPRCQHLQHCNKVSLHNSGFAMSLADNAIDGTLVGRRAEQEQRVWWKWVLTSNLWRGRRGWVEGLGVTLAERAGVEPWR